VKKYLSLMAALIVLAASCPGLSQSKNKRVAEKQTSGDLVFPLSDADNQGVNKIPPLVLP
jgi:hypothetical protein